MTLLCLLCTGNLSAYNFDYVYLTDPDNRMGHSVSSMTMDREGYLWIASRSGISRYDGRTLKHYTLAETEIFQDRDGRQVQVRKSGQGNIWAFTDSGKIYYYDTRSDSFASYADLGQRSQSILVHDLYIDSDNLIWIATTRGLLCYEVSAPDNGLQVVPADVSINCISPFSSSVLCLGTTRGVLFFDTDTRAVKNEVLCDGHNIMSLFRDKGRGCLWIGSFSSGLYTWSFSEADHDARRFSQNIPSSPIKAIREWTDGKLLVGLDGRGVYVVEPETGKAELFLSNDDQYGAVLKANNVYDILVDGDNIWVGTYTGGVTLIKGSGAFEWVRHIPYERQSVKGTHIYAIHEDRDGDMWYATNLGVSFHDKAKNRWTHFLEEENSFLTIAEDHSGLMWTGGYSTGLYCIDKRRGVVRYIPSLENRPQLDCIYASLADKDGDLWFGCLYSSLVKMSRQGGRETLEFYDIKQVKSLTEVADGLLLVATSNGFYLMDKATGEKRRYFSNPAGEGIESNSFIYSSLIADRLLWFGTDGGGLNCMDMETGAVSTFSTYDGLPSNFIYGIVQDGEGMLWVSTDNGIFCFDPFKKQFLFTVDNLPLREFLFMSFARLKDGSIAFGGTNGAVIFKPDDLRPSSPGASLRFTDFRISYQSITPASDGQVLPRPLDQMQELILRHNQNSFSFGFIAVELYNPDHYSYRYILKGFDEKWTENDKALTANYTNISPGRYTFRVECLNRNNGQVISARQMAIRIKEPFWNTAWAWTLYVLIAAALIFWAWRYYRERLLKQQSRERVDFFVNVAHDIRTPLSLVLAPLGSLEKEVSETGAKYLKLARQNGDKLYGIVNQLLEFQKEDARGQYNTTLTVCDLKDFLRAKVEQFQPMAQEKDIDIRLEMPSGNIYVETNTKKLDRIVDNLLSNAVKYSGYDTGVIVRLRSSQKKLVLEVEDFGIGIAKKEQKKVFNHMFRGRNAVNSKETGAGIGLMYTRKLARRIGADLDFTSQENKGTTFYLTFPEKNISFALSPEERSGDGKSAVKAKRHYTDSYRILLVEDNDDMRNYLTGMLAPDYKLYSVPSAERALEFLKTNMTDLIISDVMMDGMRGDEMCRLLKNNIETSHIHIILLTAVTDKDKMLSSLERGADDYITKPFDIEVLRMKIRNALQTRKKLQQHYLTRNDPAKEESADGLRPDIRATNLDEDFLAKCVRIVNDNLSDSGFAVLDLCSAVAMSRTLVYEKLKALTGQSPNEFIRVIRLKRAYEFLSQGGRTIPEVAEMTGFADTKYFSTVFKKYYGASPSKVAAK